MELYPAAPAEVPIDLARPTRAYRWRAWLAALALALFVALYLGLTLWFGAFGLRLLHDARAVESHDAMGAALLSIPVWFFFAFLVSGLFFVKRPRRALQREITERDEPTLFAFLHRIAADVRAPRPYRVFLAPGVNAGVYYDLSILNLIYPSRKNLELGMGLVNTLTLSELKAVIAHEFGHFGQDMMALGRWVYVAEQIAGRIVMERGIFDRFLRALARIDVRLMVVAWPMMLLIWAIRAVLDTAFAGVALALRALLREMELQADLVSVTVAGSDCLVHALHKLQAADDAHDRALVIARAELAQRRTVPDVFAVQSRVIERIREVIGDPRYGEAPALPETGRASHRVFPERFAQPPRMWATHPPNREREDNAKRRYVGCTFDDRSAWTLFADPAATRQQLTRALLEAGTQGPLPAAISLAASLEQVDRRYARTFFDRRYRGVYLNRPIAVVAPNARELYDQVTPDADGLEHGLAALYPAAISQDLERWRELARERAMLEALREGSLLTTSGRNLVHRGREIRRSELSGAIAEVAAELDLVKAQVLAHDRACRTLHLKAAERLGRGWPEYLRGLLCLLHYVEHSRDDLEDVAGQLRHVFTVASADRRISRAEVARLVEVGCQLHGVIANLVGQSRSVMVSKPVAQRLGIQTWAGCLPQQLPPRPTAETLPGWLSGVEGWINAVLTPLRNLGWATIESLLEVEAHVASGLRDGRDPGDAPHAPIVPSSYALRVPGTERKRHERHDFWARFRMAHGIVPGSLRLIAACAVLAPVFLLGAPRATVMVVNGLGIPVTTSIGEVSVNIEPHGHASVSVPTRKEVAIRSITSNGNSLIEEFAENLDNARAQYVYNVASATPLLQWTATYGRRSAPPPRILGTPLWSTSQADVLFDSPPKQLQSSSGGGSRVVLESGAKRQPFEQIEVLGADDSAERLLNTHLRWERPLGNDWYAWLWAGQRLPRFRELLQSLLRAYPEDANLRVIELESAPDSQTHGELCARAHEQARTTPDDADALFLTARCVARPEQRSQAVLEAYAARPEHGWTALAAGMVFAQSGQLVEAEKALGYVKRRLRFMAPLLEQAISAQQPDRPRHRRSAGAPPSVQ